ncbi:MAG: 30S ribosomal protein S5 [Dehalococcoidia bacterium]|nr:30S ribosomal protein S5 [Dehalococcoidia bacterium]
MKAATRIYTPTPRIDITDMEFTEKLVSLDRVTKVVKGGKNMHFRALVVVGDGKGHVGVGLGKAREVPEAIRKAGVAAKKSVISMVFKDNTIPHASLSKFGAARVLLKPAAPGTGVIAGGGVRAVVEAAGVKDILTKSLGCANPVNVTKATILALANLRDPQESIRRRKGMAEAEENQASG